ncbi:MAG TPA: PhoPQ-activated pathogenicity-related family protein [Terracidiphilus sp.]|nr:PhoPQ-activated pathogenicity-related family protein [Terracidiphilus sp.]
MRNLRNVGAVVCLASVVFFAGSARAAERQTALDAYVHAPDSHYQYTLVAKTARVGCTEFLLRMTSQEWRTPAEVTPSVWQHWLRIEVPQQVSSPIGFLYIRGGSIGDGQPKPEEKFVAMATMTHTVVSELFDVPNEPLTFANDSYGPREEDQIIAYTWRKFIETGDSNWPLRLPMTKAAVRAMDTVTTFAGSEQGGHHVVNRFVVSGASKRGWTTWTTAAVDKRVVAIAPMVIDVLNVVPSLEHHYESYGYWAHSVRDYFHEGLMDQMDNRRFKKLMDIEDPFSYRDRLTMPKLMVNAAGDQFFLPDSSQFYFDQLPGENHLLYEANTDHSLHDVDSDQSIEAFYESIVEGITRPKLTWTFEPDGAIRVTMDRTPLAVTLWQANNPEHRDFREESIGRAYQSSPLEPESPGVYVARVAKPARGWTAFFVEATFPGPGKNAFKFTTAVRVLPDVEPFSMPVKGKTVVEPEPR